MSRPKKRSLTLGGHRTSVTLEDEFWRAFRDIATEKNLGLNELAAEIDVDRGTETGLATAIRLYVLAYYRARAIS
ncbi:aryl-sulfate sulfotransferase [Thioclava sediminum]|uniref:Ribbon-helix-helix domain-containing protein n=2 Tax=Thioclava TaxID=285107 RepID=A0ABX6YTF9_9RHOB|nr:MULTISPECIES: ribbon-helix-helix domain-containing protein [Thioclava]MAQ38082.1 aryl-sulfate sulfotransferase [Thioclava sp.]MPQ93251.1 ribbon-helix-helix domain-containing protein [Thioclava sp. JE_KL1]OOY03056.1 aryl-sulfate sulfotransferase [Thioclava sp. F28-4]OOY07303.1 aryl-sulfate sulfotransferase [Thioclava sp. F36-7]OOY16395.1 aryl-sulfate sulfotransferase [Thioclava sp. DLFJ4-1]